MNLRLTQLLDCLLMMLEKLALELIQLNILHIKSANPVLTIQDTETGLSSADSRIRLAESDGSGGVENYWDIKQDHFIQIGLWYFKVVEVILPL